MSFFRWGRQGWFVPQGACARPGERSIAHWHEGGRDTSLCGKVKPCLEPVQVYRGEGHPFCKHCKRHLNNRFLAAARRQDTEAARAAGVDVDKIEATSQRMKEIHEGRSK